jgi:hypothetical protein
LGLFHKDHYDGGSAGARRPPAREGNQLQLRRSAMRAKSLILQASPTGNLPSNLPVAEI